MSADVLLRPGFKCTQFGDSVYFHFPSIYYQTATLSIKLKLDFGPFVQVVNEMDAEPCHPRSGTLLRSIAFEPVFCCAAIRVMVPCLTEFGSVRKRVKRVFRMRFWYI